MAQTGSDQDRLKHRLIGASVLIAIMVIFLPMILLDEARERAHSLRNPLPDSPFDFTQDILGEDKVDFPPEDVPIPLPGPTLERIQKELGNSVQVIETVEQASAAAQAAPLPATHAKPEAVVASATEQPAHKLKLRHWAVQVGSFSEPKNAFTMRDRLRNKGYHAFIDKYHGSAGEKLRVRIGPLMSRNKAQSTLRELADKQDLQGIITFYRGQ